MATNPWFGIPADISGKMTTTAEAEAYRATHGARDEFGNLVTYNADGSTSYAASPENTAAANERFLSSLPSGYLEEFKRTHTDWQSYDLLAPKTAGTSSWYDPATGQPNPIGAGMPVPLKTPGKQILNEQDLQSKREELAKAGVPQADWSKYISSPDAQGRLFYNQPATLISPTGQKRVVPTGSTEANQLFGSGWTLMGSVNDKTINAPLLTNEAPINIGSPATNSSYQADAARASATEDTKATDAKIAELQKMLTPPETALSKRVSDLLADIGDDDLTGRSAMQASEEQKRGIEAQVQAMTAKNTELKKKLAEINALTASYQLANQQEEGRPQTLSRLQGAQAQNYKMYLAQKNMLTSEAGYIQAELLGMQGEIEAAQKAADRAVDLEFSDRQDAYNQKLAQLQILQPQLEKEEARYASAVTLYLKQQADALAEQKQFRKDIMAVKLEAISSGITDASILSRIGNAKSYDEALQIFGTNIPNQGEKGIVQDLILKYPDAGITINDTLAVAQSKLSKSRIYLDQVRGPVGSGGGSSLGVLGLTNQQIDNISPLVTQFQNSDIVKNYNTIGEAYNFVNSLPNNTTNPANDQALIYALAKALDPGSVVREGEYATAQKYAQSWINAYGKSVTQALAGTGFLSESARSNIKATINSRFKAAETSYNNLYSETQRRINLIGNTDKGEQLLNNYGGAFAPTNQANMSYIQEPIVSEPQQNWWSKVTNWLWGD